MPLPKTAIEFRPSGHRPEFDIRMETVKAFPITAMMSGLH